MNISHPATGGVYIYERKNTVVCGLCKLQPLVKTILTEGFEPFRISMCARCDGAGCTYCTMHDDYIATGYKEMLSHLEDHQQAGHNVNGAVKTIKKLLGEE